MKKKILFGLFLFMMIIPIYIVSAANQEQNFFNYKIGLTVGVTQQYMQFTTNESDGYKYQNANFTVSKILADSGGDGSNCTFCKLVVTGKKKNWLGIYTNLKSPVTIATPKTGYYKAANYGNVGYGTYRHYIKNASHQSNSGIFRVNAQTFS